MFESLHEGFNWCNLEITHQKYGLLFGINNSQEAEKEDFHRLSRSPTRHQY